MDKAIACVSLHKTLSRLIEQFRQVGEVTMGAGFVSCGATSGLALLIFHRNPRVQGLSITVQVQFIYRVLRAALAIVRAPTLSKRCINKLRWVKLRETISADRQNQ